MGPCPTLAGLVAIVGTAVQGIANYNLPVMSNLLYLASIAALSRSASRVPDGDCGADPRRGGSGVTPVLGCPAGLSSGARATRSRSVTRPAGPLATPPIPVERGQPSGCHPLSDELTQEGPATGDGG